MEAAVNRRRILRVLGLFVLWLIASLAIVERLGNWLQVPGGLQRVGSKCCIMSLRRVTSWFGTCRVHGRRATRTGALLCVRRSLQHAALSDAAVRCATLQHAALCCNTATLQHAAPCCNTLRYVAQESGKLLLMLWAVTNVACAICIAAWCASAHCCIIEVPCGCIIYIHV